MKNIAQTMDAEPVESGSCLATSRNTPVNRKPDESDAEDWAGWLVFLLIPEGKRFDGLLVTQISSGGKIWIISSWLSGDGSYQAFVARLSKP